LYKTEARRSYYFFSCIGLPILSPFLPPVLIFALGFIGLAGLQAPFETVLAPSFSAKQGLRD
jgi:hypothetical protein